MKTQPSLFNRFVCFGLLTAMSLLLFSAVPNTQAQQAVIRIGDVIDIRASGIPAEEMGVFSSTQSVDENGMLSFPYIDKVHVAGMTCVAAQRAIESRLRNEKIFSTPTIVLNIGGGMRVVRVIGEIKGGGTVPYTPDLTVMSSIASAGGFNDFADKRRVKLTRAGKVQVLDTTKFSRDPSLDVKVLPGDQIFVPQASAVPFLF